MKKLSILLLSAFAGLQAYFSFVNECGDHAIIAFFGDNIPPGAMRAIRGPAAGQSADIHPPAWAEEFFVSADRGLHHSVSTQLPPDGSFVLCELNKDLEGELVDLDLTIY